MGRYNPNSYEDEDLPGWQKTLLSIAGLAVLCGLVWLLVTFVK